MGMRNKFLQFSNMYDIYLFINSIFSNNENKYKLRNYSELFS